MRSLKEIRQSLSMSQEDLARKTGYSSKTASRYERGVQKPSLRAARIFVNALYVDLEEVAEFQELLGSIYGQASTEEEMLPKEEEPQPEPPIVDIPVPSDFFDDRVLSQVPHSPKEDSEEPQPKPNPKVEVAQTTPAEVAKAVSNASVEPKGNLTGVGLGKGSILLPFGYGLSRLPEKIIWVLLLAVIVAIAGYFGYKWYSNRAQRQLEATKPREPQTVSEFLKAKGYET